MKSNMKFKYHTKDKYDKGGTKMKFYYCPHCGRETGHKKGIRLGHIFCRITYRWPLVISNSFLPEKMHHLR